MPEDGWTKDDLDRGERLFARPWIFVKGVVALDALPPADRPEIAFAGRSNVGKSSLINALARDSTMARTSNTPGRTQELNFFTPPEREMFLVDLPGYGFAKAPKDKVDAWQSLLKGYLKGRPTLARVFLLIDSRHGIKAVDKDIMKLLDASAVAYQVVLTKSDKISDSAVASVLKKTETGVREHPAAFPAVSVTSAEKGDGIEDLRAAIAAIARDHKQG